MNKTSTPRKSRAKAARAASSEHVVPHNGSWAVRGAGNNRISSTHDTQASAQAAAVKAARTSAESKGGHFVVHGADGRMREAYSIGREPFLKISAVEGIAPSGAAQARAANFEKRGLTPEQRRAAIIKVHRPTKG